MKILLLFPLYFVALALTQPLAAKTCELTIEANDEIQYDQSELVVQSDCTELKLTLEHTGSLPVDQMGHNWTLTRTSDWRAVAQAGQGAGLASDYLPEGDERIIAHTDLIGGGQATTITFELSILEQGGDYTYFCSFPGHYALMNGKLIVR